MIHSFLTGFFLGLSLIVAIGAQNTFVLRQGVLGQYVFYVALFCALSDALLICIGVTGISFFFHSFSEMLFTYERICSLTSGELVICPTDYPYLYVQAENTNIYLGEKYHWRKIDATLCTFLTSTQIIEKHWDKFLSMCTFEHYPFESPLHEIYKQELCISPIPSIAIHCTNINSIYGLSPNKNWKKMWDENKV